MAAPPARSATRPTGDKPRVRRWIIFGLAVAVLAAMLRVSPVLAAQISGAVDTAYGFYDPHLDVANDRRAELLQSYTLAIAGDIWAPEVGSYRSTLRYDTTTHSLEESGGTTGNNVRGISLETRVFPYSPLNLTVGANARRTTADDTGAANSGTTVDEAGFYGRLGIGFAGMPPTTLQFSHNATAGRRGDGDTAATTMDSTVDQVSLTTVLRRPTTQTQINLRTLRSLDQVFGSETTSQGVSVQFTGTPSLRWQVRATAEAGTLDTSKTSGTIDALRQSLSLRTLYQPRLNETLQVVLSGSRNHQDFIGDLSGERNDYSTLMSSQYTRRLSQNLQGVLGASFSRMTLSAPSDPADSSERNSTSVRGEVSSLSTGPLSWTGALILEQLEIDSALKPGATMEGRMEYRLRPGLAVGTALIVYRNTSPETAAPTDDTGRQGLQCSLRWVGGATGRATLVAATTAHQYATGTGSDNKITLTGGVSPRGDLDLSADVQYGRSETPTLPGGWSRDASLTAAAIYRPRSDFTLTFNASHQQTDTADGTRLTSLSILKAEYLFYALRFGASAKFSQVENVSVENQRAMEYLLSVRRDF